MKPTYKIAIALIIIICAFALIHNANQDSNQMPGQKHADLSPIKVGVSAPLTGDAASLGELVRNVSDMAVEKINAEGGISGHPISLVYEDDSCSPAKSVSAVQKLISVDKIKTIVISTCSGAVVPTIPVATETGTFFISGLATSPTLTNISPMFARTVPSDTSQGVALANYAISKGYKKIVIIHEMTDYPASIKDAFANVYATSKTNAAANAGANESGGDKNKLVVEGFAAGTTDFRSVLAKAKAQNPDALFLIPGSPASGDRLISDFEKLSWNVPLMGGDIFSGNSEVVKKHKAALEGIAIAEQNPGPDTAEYVQFRNEYKNRFGKDLIYESRAQAQYDLFFILRDGLKKYGDDPAKIAAWVRTIKDYPGFSGSITIGSNGDRVGNHAVKIIKDGKAVAI